MSAFDFNAEPDDFDMSQRRPLRTADAQRALIQSVLADLSTSHVRRALTSVSPQIVVLVTPSPAWSAALAAEISSAYDNVWAVAVTERRKDGNKWLSEGIIGRIEGSQHVVLCLHDTALAPQPVLAAADIKLKLPYANSRAVRRAIRHVTGGRPQLLQDSDVAGLDFPTLLLALRPGSTAKECCERLRRASGNASSSLQQTSSGPGLEALPLCGEVSTWAPDLVRQLVAVKIGELPPAELRYAVLCGPPGSGKTLIAGAIARSAGWHFHTATFGEWFTNSDGNLGGVSRACVSYFDQLLEQDCSIGFLDEIDSLPSRASLRPQDAQWWSTIVNLMLTQIERLRASGKQVILLAATNFYERLDPALIRAGRLEQRVVVRAPETEQEVRAVFAHYLKDEISSVDLRTITPFAIEATPAEVAGWVREARSMARRAGRKLVPQDLLNAIAPPDMRPSEDLEAVAVHEAGHCVVARLLNIEVEYVSIISKGRAGGVTHTAALPAFPNVAEVENHVTMLLGGRAADGLLGSKGVHAGASMDLAAASHLLKKAHAEWGLYEALGPGPASLAQTDEKVEARLQALLKRSTELVRSNSFAVKALADALLEKRLLVGESVDALVKHHPSEKGLSP